MNLITDTQARVARLGKMGITLYTFIRWTYHMWLEKKGTFKCLGCQNKKKSQSPQNACSMHSIHHFEPLNHILAVLWHDDSGWTPITLFITVNLAFLSGRSANKWCCSPSCKQCVQAQFTCIYYDMKSVDMAFAMKPCPRDKPQHEANSLYSFERWPVL